MAAFSSRRVLVVDDEFNQMRALCDTLGMEGFATKGFSSAHEALAALQPGQFDLLLTDLMMPEMGGITLIAKVKEIDPAIDAIVMTGHGTIDTAVQAMQVGALDYILKPFRLTVILAVIGRALDVQALRRENAALQEREQRRSEELAAAYKDLESFSYSISHDLRAPLVFVKGFAEMLENEYAEQLGEKGRHMVRVIRDGTRSMDQMIVGMLAFSRASRQPLHRARVDMHALVQAVAHEAQAGCTGPARIEIEALPPAAGDASAMRHVWSNLVGNALKYSAKQLQPRICISAAMVGGETIYQVQDNGVGFDMQHADRLFQVFKRLHNAVEFTGTGVGLAIVHRIIARHGGRIWAESEPGAGARFCFTLPDVSALQELPGSKL